MDLLKTLLVYMIMTATGATLETGATPIPYAQLHTPTPVVTPTPTPTPSPTPTITPTATMPLTTLKEGSRGANVRLLQQALIDMGYLSGEVDGIYGQQTRDAVIAFQQRNGLEDDGIAGPQTLDKLYNNPNALPAAGMETPFAPTQAPTQAPAAAHVTVHYQTADGQTLAADTVLCYEGESVLQPDPSILPAGYRLSDASSQTVAVSPNGAASPDIIVFICEPITANVVIVYQTPEGETLHTATQPYLAGTHTVSADDTLVPQGYTLAGQRLVAFAVSEQGVASPAIIVFTYQKPAETATPSPTPTMAPATATPSPTPTLTPATVAPSLTPTLAPATATPSPTPTISLTVAPTATPTLAPTQTPAATPTLAITPTLAPMATPTATSGVIIEITSELPVEYRLGDQVIAATAISMPREDTLVYPDASLLPEGYELTSMNAVSLLADALPDAVIFDVQEALLFCSIDIFYETNDGQLLASEHRQISTQNNTVEPNHALISKPYVLISAAPVAVPAEQIASGAPNSVTFRYREIILSQSASCVTVDGKQLSTHFMVDAQHQLYLPLKKLSADLFLSYSTENGFACQWNGHALNIICDDGAVLSISVDGESIIMSEDILLFGRENEIFATPAFFTSLGYDVTQDGTALSTLQ